jgi:hypothetical protein
MTAPHLTFGEGLTIGEGITISLGSGGGGGIVLTLQSNWNGTGYFNSTTNTPTSGGHGTGLTVDWIQGPFGDPISPTINNPGTGYIVGDIVTILSGNNDGTLTITSVS